jgi:hypothetical protein
MRQNSAYTNELKTAREEEEELISVDNSVTSPQIHMWKT